MPLPGLNGESIPSPQDEYWCKNDNVNLYNEIQKLKQQRVANQSTYKQQQNTNNYTHQSQVRQEHYF
ncbi:hypothetical protein E3Q22_01967 [Wallemia mellicola]|uniref:Uncharacterized protein n=2 Tax=Wallemia mellicola TaxID=1708541 RepID=A0A4T0RHU9_9BASI|nr:hypothetical protein WALSEDRAFT_66617 [Wallemia mellicola CBS 633.66]TIB71084.1 hypothetical protein E3Q23_03929 [Wallemia mellicola]EIM19171.1 hypothetical protein WALSEDRAFT_66617 [Wallemia mellicola CBS 633.66]TIB79966.1 hypothetical protein E3Q21_03975 [Wallemia mellicola]TIB80264.1 hypothetical protein E3Q22_01967 [Wallemia mellicola]TIB83886.1 hypothetical protein E3Q20_03928 [Wallemia mellicola]|eukprot:XP_006960792.1 hypothetical protein WALSEDRAFT_66617 [Wallemia mellicola CBS 633.66]